MKYKKPHFKGVGKGGSQYSPTYNTIIKKESRRRRRRREKKEREGDPRERERERERERDDK